MVAILHIHQRGQGSRPAKGRRFAPLTPLVDMPLLTIDTRRHLRASKCVGVAGGLLGDRSVCHRNPKTGYC